MTLPTARAPGWKPAAGLLTTPWTDRVDSAAPLPEYPRPQLVRANWTNLNGLWDYAILPRAVTAPPAGYEGKILVPFAAESALSGVKRRIGPGERLWYRRTFAAPDLADGRRLRLHFGAVNWQADIRLNGELLRRHEGGYEAFAVDLTDALKPGATQELVIAVWNLADTGAQPRGKQVSEPANIWYTPVTGIWQTVWLETVPPVYVRELVITPDFDSGRVRVQPELEHAAPGAATVDIAVSCADRVVAQALLAHPGDAAEMALPAPRAWSPEDPFLYDVEVTVRAGGHEDRVRGYFGLRKIGLRRAADGYDRVFLNNRPIFLLGPLDQGWWPDGLYTAPTEEALRWDVAHMRASGFNLVRKHVKTEPARWYYHCDRLGLLVWQDMPNACRAGTAAHWVKPAAAADGVFTPEEDAQFRRELAALVAQHRGFPCIIAWAPFNEGWGQHDTNEILAWVKQLDPARLVDGPGGWRDFGGGDLLDRHEYPGPDMWPAQSGRATVLGEFGGLGLPLAGHLWQAADFHQTPGCASRTAEELAGRYAGLLAQLPPLIARGLAAAVYTQLTDVEGEVNGLVTYDRRVVKIPAEKLAALHAAVIGASAQG